jgi:hypothetical protein
MQSIARPYGSCGSCGTSACGTHSYAGLQDWYYKIIPREPEVTAGNGKVCIDSASERVMQTQRKLTYMAGGPLLAYAGLQMDNRALGLITTALGVFYTLRSYQSHKAVDAALAQSDLNGIFRR